MASSDATLVERLPFDRSGDELRELYRRYAPELFGFATSALGDRELAEEVVQDVFAQLWRHAEDYDQRRASVRTWLYAIARNRIIDAHRRAAARAEARRRRRLARDRRRDRRRARPRRAPLAGHHGPGAAVAAHREVIRLAHYGGLTMREIAERTGVPLGTVKSRTSYALRHLRLIFDEMEIEP